MVNYTPTQRSVAQYENNLTDLRKMNIYLQEIIQIERSKLEKYSELNNELQSNIITLEALRREKREMFISLYIVLATSTVGAGLISSYPMNGNQVSVGFWIGWTMLGLGFLITLSQRGIAEFVKHKWPDLLN